MTTPSISIGSDGPQTTAASTSRDTYDLPMDAKPKRLVLCFDGTGNKFSADETDTNIIKIFEMLDRTASDQYHYYQTGIGTYVAGRLTNTLPTGYISGLRLNWSETIDSMFGTSFVHHVVGGYRFLLQYYAPGDKIYIFGFSRGAYTARFLSEMIDNIGLLSRGNDEMIQFAWNTFSHYQRLGGSQYNDNPDENEDIAAQHNHGAGREPLARYGIRPPAKTRTEAKAFMEVFRSTFCRPGCRVHFLGLFDCVNSIGSFNITRKSTPYIPTLPARHIRHALSVHERRSKFKPSLFLVNPLAKPSSVDSIEEVWFAGNHGDCGGGWWLETDGTRTSEYLLSDIALRWMVEEVRALDRQDPGNGLVWREDHVTTMMEHEEAQQNSWKLSHCRTLAEKQNELAWLRRSVHDPLLFGGGLETNSVIGWRFLEILPFSRWELFKDKKNPGKDTWQVQFFPPNYGARRDIPKGAKFHPSLAKLVDHGLLDQTPTPRDADTTFWVWRFLKFLFSREIPEEKNFNSNQAHTVAQPDHGQ